MALPANVLLADDVYRGNAMFAASGDWTYYPRAGHGGDLHFSQAGSGGDAATWNFALPSSGTYRVSATWAPDPNRASNAPFTVNGSAPILIDQRQAPGDFLEDGIAWRDLGNFAVADTSLTVRLADQADGYVIADAIRMEPIAGAEIAVDRGGDLIAESNGDLDFGTTQIGKSIAETFRIRNVGTEPLTIAAPADAPAGFSFSSLPPAAIAPGESAEFSIVFAPQLPGEYGGDVVFETNDADEGGVRLSLAGRGQIEPVLRRIDNGDAGFTTSGGWTLSRYLRQGFDGDVHYASPGGGAVAAWHFDHLPAGEYRVLTTWSTHANRATNAPFSIDGSAPIRINQQAEPDDAAIDGTNWERLGEFTVSDGTLDVTLASDADGFVIADAVTVVLVSRGELRIELDGVEVHASDSLIGFGVTDASEPVRKTLRIGNVGTEPLAVFGPTVAPDGFSYNFGPTVATGSATASAEQRAAQPWLQPGEWTSLEVTLDAAQPGSFGGLLSFVSTDTDETAFGAELIGHVAAPPFEQIIDDGDAGFTLSGDWTEYLREGPENDVRFARRGDGANLAAWDFQVPEPGVYAVWATWTAHRNRATDAPYSINGGPAVRVNQERLPEGVLLDGRPWQHLGDIEVKNGRLTVTLSDDANEYVIADAIRVERLTLPTPQIVDGGDPGFAGSGDWTRYRGQGREGSLYFSQAGDGSDRATWTFRLPIPGRYRVSTTWTPHDNRATDAKLIVDGGGGPITVTVDQERSPNDFLDDGTAWEDVALIEVPRASLRVSLSDAADEYVIADAVRVEYVAPLGGRLPLIGFQSNRLPEPTAAWQIAAWQNPFDPFDVDNSGFAGALDVLLLVNEINQPEFTGPNRRLPATRTAGSRLPFLDINGDGRLTALDAMQLINVLNASTGGEGEGAAWSAFAAGNAGEGEDAAIVSAATSIVAANRHDDRRAAALPDADAAPPTAIRFAGERESPADLNAATSELRDSLHDAALAELFGSP